MGKCSWFPVIFVVVILLAVIGDGIEYVSLLLLFEKSFSCLQLVPFDLVFFSADGFDSFIFLGFLQWRNVGLGFSEFNLVSQWLTVFTCSSSANSELISFSSRSSCVAICTYVPLSKWAWFLVFFSCRSFFAWKKSSIMAWAAIPNACLEFVDKNYLFLFW